MVEGVKVVGLPDEPAPKWLYIRSSLVGLEVVITVCIPTLFLFLIRYVSPNLSAIMRKPG